MSDTEVFLVRRWGTHDADQTVKVDETMAEWLVKNNFAERPDARGTASAGSLAPGTDGADLRAGGDVSRGGGMRMVKGSRVDGENYANRAARVPGAPRAGGAVAPEQLPKSGDPEQDEDAGERGKASGESTGSAPAYPVSQQRESSQPAKVGAQSAAEVRATQGR
jgi:hypothetical protein